MSAYEIYAVHYASQDDRRSPENFLGGDLHDRPMPMDFFVWAIVGPQGTIMVDTGFDAQSGRGRGRPLTRPVAEGLKQLGIAPESVKDVIITHLHWDHAGNHDLFPNARYHVQEREMHFCTGRCMCQPTLRKAYNKEDVMHMVQRTFEGRVTFHEPQSQFADGISLHWVGGHSKGLQVVRVRTRRGFVVLASDAAHYYENALQRRAYPLLVDLDDMLKGFEALDRLSDGPSHIIPGHDPQVLALFPAARAGLAGIVRLDAHPLGQPT
ncbi:N-acyl homoserine lactonase family protein [Aquabacter sp. CN5-332]|uniref:N-acyl homoserine lactonase family protein n=1 Tax=Aquabacter sp. CN5-332 TaxID=3156608 RepID=UPI0032B556F2